MFVVETQKDKTVSIAAKEVTAGQARALGSKLAQAIVREIALEPSYPKELAKKLRVHEQKVYYHIRKLEKAGLVEVSRQITVGGTSANVYALTSSAFVIKMGAPEKTNVMLGVMPQRLLEPFVENGTLNATIIVGSPDPHGPEMARSRDGYYGIDFALFLGTFLNHLGALNVKLDTEVVTEDLSKNLILIGGPVVNMVSAKINDTLPVRFVKDKHWAVYSTLSKNVYHSEETGIIVKAKNPFNKKKWILLVAGKRYAGTKAVMIALIKNIKEIVDGNRYKPDVFAKVVEGVDKDSDGIVDSVRILE